MEEFLDQVEARYGQYNEMQAESVVRYLSRLSGDYLEELLDQVIRSVRWEYKAPPSIAVFVELRGATLDALRERQLLLAGAEHRRMIAEAKDQALDRRESDALIHDLYRGLTGRELSHEGDAAT